MSHPPARFRSFTSRLTLLVALAAPVAAQAQSGAAEIVELLCGRTVHYFDIGIGNQIEYTNPDGSAFLWHPFAGPTDLVVGSWRLVFPEDGAADQDVQVCYTYPDDAFGPGTGGDHCFTYQALIEDIPRNGIRDGDPYDLSSGTAPFRLPLAPAVPPEALAGEFPDAPRGPGCSAYVS